MKKVYLETQQGRKSIEVHTSFIQLYAGAADRMYGVSGLCSYHLLYWALNHMNYYNVVSLNGTARGEFVADSVSGTHKRYADQTVKKAIKELVHNDLMISMSDRGKREASYMMNPNCFWKSPKQADRMETIKAYKYKKEEHEAN